MVLYFLKSGLGVLNPLVLIRGFLLYSNYSQILAASKQRGLFLPDLGSASCVKVHFTIRARSCREALFASQGLPSSGACRADSNQHIQSVLSFEY